MITSIKNPKIQLVRQLLSSKKQRVAHEMIVIEGVRLAEEAYVSDFPIKQCFYCDGISTRGRDLMAKITNKHIPTEEISSELMDRISDTQTSQGILLLCSYTNQKLSSNPDFILVLDQISDPGNLGTILRTASGLGVDSVFLTSGSTDPFSPKALRAGLGAQLNLPIKWMDANELENYCKNSNHVLKIFASLMDCENECWNMDLTEPLCLVIGSEANGVSKIITNIADQCLSIPISKNLESYNAAMAAGILMYEVARQRKIK